jgi:hypothetical protein
LVCCCTASTSSQTSPTSCSSSGEPAVWLPFCLPFTLAGGHPVNACCSDSLCTLGGAVTTHVPPAVHPLPCLQPAGG